VLKVQIVRVRPLYGRDLSRKYTCATQTMRNSDNVRLCLCPVQVVHNVQLVRARPLYGFYAEEQVFVKLVL